MFSAHTWDSVSVDLQKQAPSLPPSPRAKLPLRPMGQGVCPQGGSRLLQSQAPVCVTDAVPVLPCDHIAVASPPHSSAGWSRVGTGGLQGVQAAVGGRSEDR